MTRLFVDSLTVIDFSYLDSDRGVVGESWIVDIELAGDLDDQGMVFDFGNVKKQIKQLIDTEVDHRLLVPVLASGYTSKNVNGELIIDFPLNAGGKILHQSPSDAVLLVESETVSAERIARDLEGSIKTVLPTNVTDVVVALRVEKIDGAYYHYTHGLQKHSGQCQRIAHGHRSRIEISIDGRRNPELEAQWATLLKDSYIATSSHIVDEFSVDNIAHTRLSYTAQQGDFSIGLPSERVFTIPVESTIENIASHISELVAADNHCNVLIKAFEGVKKGAFGQAGLTETD